MDHINSIQLFQGDIVFILQNEIPRFTLPFINDIASKLVETQYKRANSLYKNIPENLGIHCFIWKHLQVQNYILHRLRIVGLTILASKFVLATLLLHGQSSNSHIAYLTKNNLNVYDKAKYLYINGIFHVNNPVI
jgi:hypothetical protein